MNANKHLWIDAYLCAMPGCDKDYKAEWGWERYRLRERMFAATMCPGEKHAVYGGHPLLSLKCDPVRAEALRAQYSDIQPGFYMDKTHWISIFLDGDVPESLIRALCDDAHALILAKLPRRDQKAIMESVSGSAE